jgi:hypothetical protein
LSRLQVAFQHGFDSRVGGGGGGEVGIHGTDGGSGGWGGGGGVDLSYNNNQGKGQFPKLERLEI